MDISYNSFLKSYALLFLLTCFILCAYEVIKSYRGFYTPVLVGIFLSLSVNETINKYKGKTIKVNRLLYWACAELKGLLRIIEDTMIGRTRKTSLKSTLLHHIVGIQIWNDCLMQMMLFKLYSAIYIIRIILKVLSKKKLYVEFKPMYLILLIILAPIFLNLFLIPRIYKEVVSIVSLTKVIAKKYNIPIGKMIETKLKEALTHYDPIQKFLSSCEVEKSKGHLGLFPTLLRSGHRSQPNPGLTFGT